MGLSAESSEDKIWSEGVAQEYGQDELEAMCTWLDVSLDLNQQRLESVTTRVGLVITFGAGTIALMAATVNGKAWPLTALASVVNVVAMAHAATSLQAVVKPDRDPTTTWRTMWGPRQPGELLVVLYRRRSVLFHDQRRIIQARTSALKQSSWALGVGTLLAAGAVILSRVA
ncbi:hypothetical protein [Kribbella pratensis]|uniref:hypothetical protein n=1 Tax=Kribbella pratensis TaxID=2512112 RepID=UPI0010668063|nr:hypothetical protein [Kribbella pratensis]